VRTAVGRHPELRKSVLRRSVPAPAPAATGESERENEDERGSHFTAFERTAPVAVARTSKPVCVPGQYAVPVAPGAVFFEPTCH